MRVLRDANVWFVIGSLFFALNFMLANYGVPSLVNALVMGLTLAIYAVAIVLYLRNSKVN